MVRPAVAVSAPGKVLFAGGFLVLDRQHTGLVFGLDARIHIHVQSWTSHDALSTTSGTNDSAILVRSPQFRDANWLYRIDPSKPIDDEAIHIGQITDQDEYTKTCNKFVQTTLQYVLTYLIHTRKAIEQSVKITIMADNDYYSRSMTSSAESSQGFTDFGVTLSEANKTGLGSSAALVAGLVAGLLAFYTGSVQSHTVIHNLGQAAHCAAQGKIGSGFDIAAAVFGSCLYRRFSPSILETVGDHSAPGFGEKLHLCIDDLIVDHKWDAEILSKAVNIPKGLLLVMCDVDCGSETPGLVRQVLQWRKDNFEEASLLWHSIQRGTEDLCKELRRLSQIEGLARDSLKELSDIISTIRSLVKEMSRKSNVPIEPDVITELLNHCSDLPGVVGGVAPGAGGYDAVALLLRNDIEVLQGLQARLEGWSSKAESTGAMIGRVRLLKVRQAEEGLRSEDVERYGDWVR